MAIRCPANCTRTISDSYHKGGRPDRRAGRDAINAVYEFAALTIGARLAVMSDAYRSAKTRPALAVAPPRSLGESRANPTTILAVELFSLS